ncbi:hypothetical protein GUITHDRAFT_120258 [Guillardia theta CCMP2712]|uniref:Ubiquitin carboxyl-terminal hydrolase n=1 Tax=Guillardia theta (strain CCMP2712) TaxID=905079 RepID=L1IBC5_GUITC|nr:hypothetical protein GUITHDRAFT_120258 [Guillardia theta CCMP2712]EKX33566.1 hypothetical protein GUITHDRAFT_120258 [Guillardia theta CCMP2712]|eukprot:XP_005820546.1 hypothetical protein GUITHDRAFT_120258 [Guillardia theta CCMP2712]
MRNSQKQEIENGVSQLQEMGARRALEACNGDLENALYRLTESDNSSLNVLADTATSDRGSYLRATSSIQTETVGSPSAPSMSAIPSNTGYTAYSNPILSNPSYSNEPSYYEPTRENPAQPIYASEYGIKSPGKANKDSDVPMATVVPESNYTQSNTDIEAQQLRQALALSLQDQPKPTARSSNTDIGLSTEEEEMARAIEQSLCSSDPSAYKEPENPHMLLRKDNMAVGLKNIGNTCYFNSLLQTYRAIPAFRHAILQCPLPPGEKRPPSSVPVALPADQNQLAAANPVAAQPLAKGSIDENDVKRTTVELVRQLQRLFAQMEISDRRFVDPSLVMQNLLDSSGDPVQVGNQQDVSEFNHIFLQRVEEGLNFASNGQATETNTIIKGIFEGKMLQEVLTKDEKTSDSNETVISSSSCEFHELILDISRGDLHGALEDYVEAQVDDYHGECSQGNQRVSYDKDIQAPVKVNDRFTFPNELFMDRYLLAHKTKLMPRRIKRNELRHKFDHLNQKLQHLLHFSSTGLERTDVAADEYLRGAMAFLKERSEGGGLEKVDHVLEMLSSLTSQTQLQDIQKQIDLLFAEFNSDRYSLFAVLVHDGLAGSGHYWVYIKRQDGWLKYSDAEVASVEEKEVWEMSEGGKKNASAYCLMYRRDKEDGKFSIHLPDLLRSEVEDDNRRLKEEMRNWDRRTSLMRFEAALNEKMQEIKVINRDVVKDKEGMNWYSFEAFLDRLQKPDLCKYLIATGTIPQVFASKELDDNETRTMFESKFHDTLVINPTDQAFLDKAREVYCEFLSISRAISAADKCISSQDMEQCVLLLCGAYELQKSLEGDLERAASFDAEVLDRLTAVQNLFLEMLEVGLADQSQTQLNVSLLLALTFKILQHNTPRVSHDVVTNSFSRWKRCVSKKQDASSATGVEELLMGAADCWKDVTFPNYRLNPVLWDEAAGVMQSIVGTRRSLCQQSNDRFEYPPVSVLYRSPSSSRLLEGDLMEVEPSSA